jgi:hypothetical protein
MASQHHTCHVCSTEREPSKGPASKRLPEFLGCDLLVPIVCDTTQEVPSEVSPCPYREAAYAV